MHSTCASSKKVLLDKTYIGSIWKMVKPKPINFNIFLGVHALEGPKNSLPLPGLNCIMKFSLGKRMYISGEQLLKIIKTWLA